MSKKYQICLAGLVNVMVLALLPYLAMGIGYWGAFIASAALTGFIMYIIFTISRDEIKPTMVSWIGSAATSTLVLSVAIFSATALRTSEFFATYLAIVQIIAIVFAAYIIVAWGLEYTQMVARIKERRANKKAEKVESTNAPEAEATTEVTTSEEAPTSEETATTSEEVAEQVTEAIVQENADASGVEVVGENKEPETPAIEETKEEKPVDVETPYMEEDI